MVVTFQAIIHKSALNKVPAHWFKHSSKTFNGQPKIDKTGSNFSKIQVKNYTAQKFSVNSKNISFYMRNWIKIHQTCLTETSSNNSKPNPNPMLGANLNLTVDPDFHFDPWPSLWSWPQYM